MNNDEMPLNCTAAHDCQAAPVVYYTEAGEAYCAEADAAYRATLAPAARNLPKTQERTMRVIEAAGRELSAYELEQLGGVYSAFRALVRKGYLTVREGDFVMPSGPYAGETREGYPFYSVAK